MMMDLPPLQSKCCCSASCHSPGLWAYLQVNYFPSRFDPVRHAEKYPYNDMPVSGRREKTIIRKVRWSFSVFGILLADTGTQHAPNVSSTQQAAGAVRVLSNVPLQYGLIQQLQAVLVAH